MSRNPSFAVRVRPALSLGAAVLVSAAALAGPPIVTVSFEEFDRGGRYESGPVAHQPLLERDGTVVLLESKRWTPAGLVDHANIVDVPDAPSGARVLSFTGPSVVEKGIPSTTSQVCWVEGWRRGDGGELTLAEADYPTAADGFPAAAIVHFSTSEGIELLDGDGKGGGTPVAPHPLPADRGYGEWMRVSLRLDYTTHTWECYVDGERAHATPLGFRDNAATATALRLQSAGGSSADAFRVLVPLPGDANTDGVVDAADLVRAAQFASFDPETYDVIGASNAGFVGAVDADGHLIVLPEDIAALRNLILGIE